MKHAVILGPCPCHGCSESVYWDGIVWRNARSHGEHSCVNRRSVGYNGPAGTSSIHVQSPTDAVALLVPGATASSRYEGRD